MGMIGYFAEIDSEKINQLLESTEKPLMDNIHDTGNDSNLLIVFYVQIMPDDFVMQLHRF
ncbi:hypothetical protein CDH59_13010 [Escherichia coli]|nr:hypothetical protein CDH59_13010 [Escherichia coli]